MDSKRLGRPRQFDTQVHLRLSNEARETLDRLAERRQTDGSTVMRQLIMEESRRMEMHTFTTTIYDSATKQPAELDLGKDQYHVCICDVDGSLVFVEQVGTSQVARCQRGHRWQHSYTEAGWIALP